MEAFQREGWPGAIADEPLDALPVIAQDADGSIDAEAAGSLPSEHAVSVSFVEETVGAKVAEYAALDDALEVEPVVGLKPGGFMELDLTIGALRKGAVEDDTVVVEVRVER